MCVGAAPRCCARQALRTATQLTKQKVFLLARLRAEFSRCEKVPMKCGFLCLLFSESRRGGRRRGAVFAQDFKPAETPARRLAPPEKNLCTGCVSWRVDRSREAKNARIGANSIRRFGPRRPSTARRWRHGASHACPILIAWETSAGIARCARERALRGRASSSGDR